MSGRAEIAPAARQDLTEIWDYIAADNPDAADRVLTELYGCFEMLTRQPRAGSRCKPLGPEMRQFPVRRYVVYYQPVDDEEFSIEVVRVIHGARDLTRAFGQSPERGH